jgi:sec-independent protein translocase protein TatA
MVGAAGPFGLGPMELVIILLVLVMLFGATRLKDLGGSLGQGIKEFRSAVKDDEEEAAKEAAKNAENAKPAEVSAQAEATPAPAATNGAEVISAVKCPSCGALNDATAKHCNQCGASIAAPVA